MKDGHRESCDRHKVSKVPCSSQPYLVSDMLERVEHFLVLYLIWVHICISSIMQWCENCIDLSEAKNLQLPGSNSYQQRDFANILIPHLIIQ